MIVKVAAPTTPATGVAVDGQQFAALLKRLEAATVKLEGLTVAPVGVGMAPAQAVAPAVSADIESPSLEAFDELVSGPLANFLALSASIGGVVAEQVEVSWLWCSLVQDCSNR